MEMKNAFEVIGWVNGRPAGYVGTYTTKARAQQSAKTQRVSCKIRRIRVEPRYFAELKARETRPGGTR